MDLKSTVKLDKFILQSKIGNGSFGEVYKVKEKKGDQIYAAKISLKTIDENSAETLLDLSREVNILSKINHPSILRFIGFSSVDFYDDPKPIIITEYLANGSLYDVIELERKSLSRDFWNDTRKLINLYGIASAMSFLHKNNIIHRDLKPGNILMDDFLFPKIADFGLSKIKHKNNESMTIDSTLSIKGTPVYMAPEVWENTTDYTTACDVYSFAIIAYEILTGLEPYKNQTLFGIRSSVLKGSRPEIPEFLPDSYKQLIENCWQQNPQDRPTFDEIVESLKTDEGFITDLIEENDYLDYVDYIDNYKTSFDSKSRIINVDEYIKHKKIQNATFKKISINENTQEENVEINVNILSTKKSRRSSIFKKKEKKGSSIYPTVEYNELDPDCQMMVQTAEKDSNKQFEIAVNLIEEKSGFPQNTEIGIKYIEQSMKNDNINAIIYYCRMLIDGEIIPQNLLTAKKILQLHLSKNNSTISLLYGMIHIQEEDYFNAKKYIKESVDAGNAEAMYEYGKMYYNGIGFQKNEKEAHKYFDLSKKSGCMKSDSFLSKEKEKIEQIEKLNKNEIIQYYKESADAGHIESMYKYGIILLTGDGVPVDKKEAARYLKNAAENDHLDGMFKYGGMLLIGDGIEQDKEKASEYFKNAARKGHANAMYNYAVMLKNGDGIEASKEKAIKYLKKAIEAGQPDAMYTYGLMLYNDGTSKDKKEAVHLFKLAANKGHVKSIFNYATILYKGEDISQDKKLASRYFKLGADQGEIKCIIKYATILEEGDGIEINMKEAIKYYKKAIKNDNKNAMFSYGQILENGKGVEVNKRKASKYYKMAAEKGHKQAILKYISLLISGESIPIEKEYAPKYYKIAADNGNLDAMYIYGKMLHDGDGVEVDLDEASRYLKSAADKGHVSSMVAYAHMKRKGFLDNNEESLKYYKLAIENGRVELIAHFILASKGDEDIAEVFRIGAEKGYPGSMFWYGQSLMKGEFNIEKDETKGFHYIKKAADAGYPDASRFCGFSYYFGDNGIDKNKEEGIRYLKIAAYKGDQGAIDLLNRMDDD